jgi:diguanylate cyclase (GGDEF)-like protein/PAS domain S-box-containing protein
MVEFVKENDLSFEREVNRLTIPQNFGISAPDHERAPSQGASSALDHSAAPLSAILDALPQMVRISDPSGRLEYRNRRFYEFTGATPGEVEAEDWKKVVHPEDREGAWAEWCRCLRTGEEYEARYRVRHHSGEYRWILARATPNYDETGNIVRWFGTSTDIHEQRQAEEALRTSEERLRLALETTALGIWDADLVTGTREWTREARDILGLAPEAPITRETFLDRVHPGDRARMEAKFFAPQPESILSYQEECRIIRADTGEERWVATSGRTLLNTKGKAIRKLGTIQDITARKEAEVEIWRAANHDVLTELPNRLHFQNCLERAFAGARRRSASLSLLLIDLDDFKDVNDSLGHHAGDTLLYEVANRLRSTVRDCDVVARLGGDEFAVLVTEVPKLGGVTGLAETIIRRLGQPFAYDGRTLVIRASVGFAVFPEHDTDPTELMKDADIALYRAKMDGGNQIVSYSRDMREATERRLETGRQVRVALIKDQITPYYQPKICLTTGATVGFEVLARWEHPERGLLTPQDFGVAFDDPDLAKALGKRMIGKVASDLRKWLNSGLDPGRVAINLSSAEFDEPNLGDEVIRILKLAKVPARHFEIEVTEKVLLEGRAGLVADTLGTFRRKGVQIALDDFGTGYASLTHLKEFPVDHIKIDQSFIRDLELDPDSAAIVDAVISLGKSLGLRVTAEGVETEGQAQRLREMGCHYGQGYLFAKPVPYGLATRLLTGLARCDNSQEARTRIQKGDVTLSA